MLVLIYLQFLKRAVEVYEMENILYIIKIILGTQLEVTFRHSCRPGWKCSKYRYQSFTNMVEHIIPYLESSNSTTLNVSKNWPPQNQSNSVTIQSYTELLFSGKKAKRTKTTNNHFLKVKFCLQYMHTNYKTKRNFNSNKVMSLGWGK